MEGEETMKHLKQTLAMLLAMALMLAAFAGLWQHCRILRRTARK